MDIPLAPEIEEVVRRKVAGGEYPSASALIEEALLLLVERDWQRSRRELFERLGGGDPFPQAGSEAGP